MYVEHKSFRRSTRTHAIAVDGEHSTPTQLYAAHRVSIALCEIQCAQVSFVPGCTCQVRVDLGSVQQGPAAGVVFLASCNGNRATETLLLSSSPERVAVLARAEKQTTNDMCEGSFCKVGARTHTKPGACTGTRAIDVAEGRTSMWPVGRLYRRRHKGSATHAKVFPSYASTVGGVSACRAQPLATRVVILSLERRRN